MQHTSNTPDATWVAAAAKTKAAEKAAAHLESAVKSLKPPPGLGPANQELAKSAQLAAQLLGQLSSALGARNAAGAQAAAASITKATRQIDSLEVKWREAVTAAAHKDRVAVPTWVTTFGTS